MAKLTQINDLFRAAADIEAETPITVGATTVGPEGRFSHREAEDHAHAQYELFERQRRELEAVSASDFDEAAKRIAEQAPPPPKPRRGKKRGDD